MAQRYKEYRYVPRKPGSWQKPKLLLTNGGSARKFGASKFPSGASKFLRSVAKFLSADDKKAAKSLHGW